jgi:predicted ATPase
MLKRLYVDNYKCLVNFEVAFGELALLLGPNGVGKTSVLDVLFALHELLYGTAKVTDRDIFPARTLTRWQTRRTQVFELDMVFEGIGDMSYRLEVEHESSTTRRARIVLERLTANGKPLFIFEHGEVQLYRDNHSEGPAFSADWSESALARVPARDDNTKLTRFLEFARNIQVCGLYPKNFETESRSEDPLLLRDGRNFSAWYRHMFQERQDLVPEYTKALRDVIEGFKSIRLATVGEETRALIVVFEERGVRYEVRFSTG